MNLGKLDWIKRIGSRLDNSILIFPVLSLILGVCLIAYNSRLINEATAEFVIKRKARNAIQSAARLQRQMDLDLEIEQRFVRLQETLELEFDNTAALLVEFIDTSDEKTGQKHKLIAYSDFRRSNRGALDIQGHYIFSRVENQIKRGKEEEGVIRVEGKRYHFISYNLYANPNQKLFRLWLVTDIDSAIAPVSDIISVIMWRLGYTLAIPSVAFLVVGVVPLRRLKEAIDRGEVVRPHGYLPGEIDRIYQALTDLKGRLTQNQGQLEEEVARSNKLYEEALEAKDALAEQKTAAEEYAEEIKRINHISAHDIKGDAIASAKAAQVILEVASEIAESSQIQDEGVKESLEFIKEYARRISSSSTNAFNLIDNRSKLSNLKEEIELDFYPVQNVLDAVTPMAYEQDGQFILSNECPPGAKAYCDLVFFPALLKNLIRNGFIHNDSTEKQVGLEVTQVDGKVRFQITDNGVGIPASYLKEWGNMLGKAAQLGDRGGSGAGLYSVRKTAEAVEAKIDVLSEVGSGTAFRIMVRSEV